MAGSQPHDKTGKKCGRCPRIFDRTTASFTVPKRIQKVKTLREYELVCCNSAHLHYAEGE